MELFIRKNKNDCISNEFYYLGKIYPTGNYVEFTMPNTNKSAVDIEYSLKTPIKDDLYDYIVNGQEIIKKIEVVAAIITDENNRVFATQRGYGEFKGGWEFPGGKIENVETKEEAIKREIKEELDVEIQVGRLIDTIEYDYPDFHLTMHCFMATVKKGSLTLKEHQAAKWLTKETIRSVIWLPADPLIIDKLVSYL